MTNTSTTITLKGKVKEIFLELCAEIDCLPYGSPLPSIRELRRRYSAGQQTIAKVLKYLAEYRNLKSHPRKRTYLSDPISSASVPFHGSKLILSGQYQSRCTTLGMLSALRDRWEKYIVAYNRTHSDKITIRYAGTPEELSGFATNTDIDFILFYTKPVAIKLLENTADFIDLRSLCAELDRDKYYPGIFMIDPDQRIWGISPGIILPVISCHRSFARKHPHGLSWDELFGELRRLKTRYPQLSYPLCLNGYILYLFNQGIRLIDPATHELRLNYAELKEPLHRLRELTRGKMLPLFSDAHYQELQQIAMASFCHFQSTLEQIRFVRARRRHDYPAMLAAIESELKLARELYELQQINSKIGFEASNHYYYTPQNLLEKIINCEYLREEINIRYRQESPALCRQN